MRLKLILFFVAFLTVSKLIASDNFRIVGYLPVYRFGLIDKIEIEKVTHLNIAFAQATADGGLILKGDYETLINKVKERNPDIHIMLSLAGGGLSGAETRNWKNNITIPNRGAFIHNILDFIFINGFDGVDIDLEWNDITPDYPGFCRDLRDSLHTFGLLFSAAFPAKHKYPILTNEDLLMFDFINVMAYDAAGPWQPKVARQHSSFELAEESIAYWQNECQVPKQKINLGIPFYGYDFSCRPVRSKTYNTMVKTAPEWAYEDQVNSTFYNSVPMIINKTKLARVSSGGVMIWELGQDVVDGDERISLLQNVYNSAISNEMGEFLPKSKKFTIWDEGSSQISIQLNGNCESGSYFVIQDLFGCTNETVHFSEFSSKLTVEMDKSAKGIFLVTLIEPGKKPSTEKLLRFKT